MGRSGNPLSAIKVDLEASGEGAETSEVSRILCVRLR